jgi:hypothetical protein
MFPAAMEDQEISIFQRVSAGRVQAKDFWSSFRTV